jgi:hypothetical protein
MKAGDTFVLRGLPISSDASAGRPALLDLARNASRAVKRVLVQVGHGRGIAADQDTIGRRQSVCQSNTCRKYEAAHERCLHPKCGCFLRLKRWLATESCPEGLW